MLVAEIKRSLAMAAAASHLSSLKQLGTQRSVFSDPRPSTPRELSLPALSATRASNMHWKWTWLNRSSTCSSRFISFSYCLDLIQKREDFCFLLYLVCLGLSRLLLLSLSLSLSLFPIIFYDILYLHTQLFDAVPLCMNMYIYIKYLI